MFFKAGSGLSSGFWGKYRGDRRLSGIIRDLAESLTVDPLLEIPDTLQAVFESDLRCLSAQKPEVVGLYVFCPTQMAYTVLFAQFIKKNMDVPVFGVGSFF